MVGGGPGTGKTYGWLTIARMLPNHNFYVLDPDDGVTRIWESEFPEVKNITHYMTPDWYSPLVETSYGYKGGIASAFKNLKALVKPNDWVVVEMLPNIWDMAQTTFVSEVFQENIGE